LLDLLAAVRTEVVALEVDGDEVERCRRVSERPRIRPGADVGEREIERGTWFGHIQRYESRPQIPAVSLLGVESLR
jgi:hypothetical protein